MKNSFQTIHIGIGGWGLHSINTNNEAWFVSEFLEMVGTFSPIHFTSSNSYLLNSRLQMWKLNLDPHKMQSLVLANKLWQGENVTQTTKYTDKSNMVRQVMFHTIRKDPCKTASILTNKPLSKF